MASINNNKFSIPNRIQGDDNMYVDGEPKMAL